MPSHLGVFAARKIANEPLAMISLYDAPTARLCCDAGVHAILVGDSLGNVVLGYENTVSVSVEEMRIFTAAVARGAKGSSAPQTPVVADLPFGSYATTESATRNTSELLRAGAHAVKLEGAGPNSLAAVRAVAEMGAPVMGHLGFTPQSALRLGGVVQGKTAGAARKLMDDARALQEAGCFAIVLEAVTSEVAAKITSELEISTIGIGAGAGCDGQVLVWHDLAGLGEEKPFRFVRRFAQAHETLGAAARDYVHAVQSRAFPAEAHGWKMAPDELQKWDEEIGHG